ncbi:AI-2E family transporter [Henriciella sp.]|uniref:AI-2E family transporter n=1 Tax=Henriciella sp. TaxID=1968823 RepID=UPI002639BE68|nr:AI-2E family transporter [Henriciella sp.]
MKHGLLSVQPESYSHWAIIGLFVMMSVAALSFAQAFFIPVIFALLLALTLSPIRRGMGRLGIGPGVSAAIIMIIFCAISAVLLFLISSSLATIVSDEPQLMNKVQERVKEMTGMLEPVRQAGEQLEQMQQNRPNSPEQVVVRQEGIFSLWAQTTPYIAGQVGLSIVLATFLIASGDMFYEKLVQVMPNLTAKQKALTIAREMERQLSTYFLTITAINSALGICVGTAMWLIGMPNPVFFGVAAFALNYIPYVGSVIGIIVTFVMAVGTYDNLLMSVVPPLAYWLINTAEGQFITPVAVGRRLRLNAVAVFLSLAFWAWLWSFAGMFLSTPMLIGLKAFSARKPELSWLDTFLEGRKAAGDRDDDVINDVMGAGNDAGQPGEPKTAEEVAEHLPEKQAHES